VLLSPGYANNGADVLAAFGLLQYSCTLHSRLPPSQSQQIPPALLLVWQLTPQNSPGAGCWCLWVLCSGECAAPTCSITVLHCFKARCCWRQTKHVLTPDMAMGRRQHSTEHGGPVSQQCVPHFHAWCQPLWLACACFGVACSWQPCWRQLGIHCASRFCYCCFAALLDVCMRLPIGTARLLLLDALMLLCASGTPPST
jgi:hypothetical protein